MRNRIVLLSAILIYLSLTGFAQSSVTMKHIIMLDDLKKSFTVHHSTLNTQELYGVDKTVEVYTIEIRNESGIMLLTVLPSLTSHENWRKVDTNTIADEILPTSQVSGYARNIFYNGRLGNEEFNSLNFGVVKKTDSGYYMSKTCLVEFFNVRHYPPPLVTPFKTLNTASPTISIRETLTNKTPYFAWAMDKRNDHYILLDRDLLRREYLSKVFAIGKDTAYQFWTFTDWGVIDGWNHERGIDRLVYIPGKGIVGGSYDFWFVFCPKLEFNYIKGIPISDDKLWDNIINEKVMLAEELKEEME